MTKKDRILRLKWKLWELQGKWQVYKEENKSDSSMVFNEIKDTINEIRKLEAPTARGTRT